MADEVGAPFTHIPAEAFYSFAGGLGMATLCGTIPTASAFIGTVTDQDTQKELVPELIKWYKKHPFPKYQPEQEIETTVAESELCEDSVGTWMQATGYEYGSDERKARCGGVAADTAVWVVNHLNEILG